VSVSRPPVLAAGDRVRFRSEVRTVTRLAAGMAYLAGLEADSAVDLTDLFADPEFAVVTGHDVPLRTLQRLRRSYETDGTLKRRIDEATRLVPLDQLCLSSQCGFSSTVEGKVLTTEEQAAKLRLIVQVAADVWG
jgi:hypothetical protein